MNIANHSDWYLYTLNIFLFNEYVFKFMAENVNSLLL